jgi:hypothetical protein
LEEGEVGNSVGTPVGEVGEYVGTLVGSPEGDEEGEVGSRVGFDVGDVGTPEGEDDGAVGMTDGWAEGTPDGDVGEKEGASDGLEVGWAVGWAAIAVQDLGSKSTSFSRMSPNKFSRLMKSRDRPRSTSMLGIASRMSSRRSWIASMIPKLGRPGKLMKSRLILNAFKRSLTMLMRARSR